MKKTLLVSFMALGFATTSLVSCDKKAENCKTEECDEKKECDKETKECDKESKKECDKESKKECDKDSKVANEEAKTEETAPVTEETPAKEEVKTEEAAH